MKKKIITILIATCFLVACETEDNRQKTSPALTEKQVEKTVTGASVSEQNIDIDGHHYETLEYRIKDDGIWLLSLTTKEADFVIPEEINGVKVVEVGKATEDGELYRRKNQSTWKCSNEQTFDHIVVPEGVTVISDLIGLRAKELVLLNGLETVKEAAFAECHLQKLIINSTKATFENSALSFGNIKEIVFSPDFEGRLKDEAFSCINELEKITLPAKKMNMGSGVFSSCKKLKEVVIPKESTEVVLEHTAFGYCPKLKELIVPEAVKKMSYFSSTYADNYKKSVETLIIKGKETQVRGDRYIGDGDYNLITVKKIVAPKNSKAIAFAKKAKNASYVDLSGIEKWPANISDTVKGDAKYFQLGNVEYEEI